MMLLGLFALIWGTLIGVAYFVGLAIETMWGSNASLLIFLVLFFGSIYLSWHAAVRLSAASAVRDEAR
jgi:hypothetical protein